MKPKIDNPTEDEKFFAERLHSVCGNLDCDWDYDTWENYQRGSERELYLEKARLMKQFIGPETAVKIVRIWEGQTV